MKFLLIQQCIWKPKITLPFLLYDTSIIANIGVFRENSNNSPVHCPLRESAVEAHIAYHRVLSFVFFFWCLCHRCFFDRIAAWGTFFTAVTSSPDRRIGDCHCTHPPMPLRGSKFAKQAKGLSGRVLCDGRMRMEYARRADCAVCDVRL